MTYTKEEARIAITKLVEDFRAQEATLEKAAEAQIENNYIRPLFRYLNWNTENAGLSHAHYEFKVQVTNKKGLRPDYILNLEGRDVLVMDAKQVKYSMKDPRWLHQVYSYAYSTQNSKPSEKMDFAILTDFQEFIVLDCTLFAAKPEAVNNFRVIDWKYTDYVTKFDELWELFERNNVLENSRPNVIARSGATKQSPPDQDSAIDEEIASGKSKSALATTSSRGLWSRYLSPQKVKANRVSPDKAFLAEMDDEKDGWRVLLAKDMKKRNSAADGELITAAVQLLIDRLIFIKALSDREVDRDYLSEIKDRVTEAGLGENEAGWFKACKSIFDELNNFYNGSIFAPRPELENVTVSNKAVQSVLTDLQPENSPYNFAVLPVEILGTIYERFLGRVVHTTDKRVTIEEKPEVRKAGGVYYTPQYIVDYIVENTLGKLLEECKTPADVAKLKVLDPSCGSGSFLLGAYSKLIEWHKDYFTRRGGSRSAPTKDDRDHYYLDESGAVRLTAKLKREILKNNLFGVDIDPQAVEVTRFSLSLKALEDLREGELTEERTLFHQTVLPDLSQNIKNGNSLVGSDYFGLIAPTAEELKEIKPFNWKAEFKEIMGNGGFDTVIGNPPYVRQETLGEHFKSYAQKNYSVYAGTADLYVYFIEQSHRLLRENGLFSFIVANKWMRSNYGKALRDYLSKNTSIQQIIDFGELPVFEKAATFPAIIVTRKSSSQKQDFIFVPIKRLDFTSLADEVQVIGKALDEGALQGENWSLTGVNEQKIFDKMRKVGISLGEYTKESVYFGIKTGFNQAFIISSETKELLISQDSKSSEFLKPFVVGDNIRKYQVNKKNNYLILIPKGFTNDHKGNKDNAWEWFRKAYPAIARHLSQFETEAKNRQDQGDYWWELRACNYYSEFEKPKILYPDIAKESRIAFDNTGIYFSNTVYFIPLNDLFLLGVLNSKLIFSYFKRIASVLGDADKGGRLRWFRQDVMKLPIRAIDFSKPAEKAAHEKMVALVSQMLALHKSKAEAKTQADTDVYERQIRAVDESIDQLVYELYGLTEEEIKIVSDSRPPRS